MLLDQETLRFVFGLKLRGLRLDRGLSLKELSRATGLSPSYLNEIEKGKKYPKTDKIRQLAESLGEDYDELISIRLKKELSLVTQLIEKNIFSGMPFEIFGIPAATVFSLLAERPKKMGALVGTLLELARGHNITVDDFFYATLRSYLDMHQNYFPSIEEKVDQFRQISMLDTTQEPAPLYESMKQYLSKRFYVDTVESDFLRDHQALAKLHYFVKADSSGRWKLMINTRLSVKEKCFIVSRELGAQYMRIKNRPLTSMIKNLDSFDQLFNHYSINYFATALLVPKDVFKTSLDVIFANTNWNQAQFLSLIQSYPCPIEVVFQRMTQILPKFFGLDHIFFLRFDFDAAESRFRMVRELHLSELHSPHGISNDEHYCQRWITTRLLNELRSATGPLTYGTQKSKFHSTENEYLNLSVAFRSDLNPHDLGCVTLGILINQKSTNTIRFLQDNQISSRIVSDTCERCSVVSCNERAASQRLELSPDYVDKVKSVIDELF